MPSQEYWLPAIYQKESFKICRRYFDDFLVVLVGHKYIVDNQGEMSWFTKA